MNKFEQLVEYVINDENDKARELFHEIVVEKSRTIYEQMMEEEELDEAKDEELDEAKDEELDEAEEELDEAKDEELDEALGGDQADDLIDDIETEEEGISMEDSEEGNDMEPEAGSGEEGLEDRVVDLEDKLDELMAEFEALMGGDEGGEEEVDGEELDAVSADDFGGEETDAEEVEDDEFETEGMMENVSLKAVAKPSNTEGASNKKSVVAANSGARGAMAKPVSTGTDGGGHHDSAAYKNAHKDLIGKVGNTPGQSTQKPSPATKPQLGQAAGVNTKPVIS